MDSRTRFAASTSSPRVQRVSSSPMLSTLAGPARVPKVALDVQQWVPGPRGGGGGFEEPGRWPRVLVLQQDFGV